MFQNMLKDLLGRGIVVHQNDVLEGNYLSLPEKWQAVWSDEALAGSDKECPVAKVGVLPEQLFGFGPAGTGPVEPRLGKVQLGLVRHGSTLEHNRVRIWRQNMFHDFVTLSWEICRLQANHGAKIIIYDFIK